MVVIDWSRELSSNAFVFRVRTCVNFTNRYGRETGFVVDYCPELRRLVHTRELLIGTENELSFGWPSNMEALEVAYSAETGKDVSLYRERDFETWMKGHVAKHPERALRMDFLDETFKLDSHDMEKTGLLFDNDTMQGIQFHTHPYHDNARPSTKDLRCLNHFRKQNFERRFDVTINPLSVIVGTRKNRSHYPILIFQERSRDPLEGNLVALWNKGRSYNVLYGGFDSQELDLLTDYNFGTLDHSPIRDKYSWGRLKAIFKR